MGEVVPPILTVEEWTRTLLALREATILRQRERRDELELTLRLDRQAARVDFNAWEEERDRADAAEDALNDPFAMGLRTRAEVAEARVVALTAALTEVCDELSRWREQSSAWTESEQALDRARAVLEADRG